MNQQHRARVGHLAVRGSATVLVALVLAACTWGLVPGSEGCGDPGQGGPSPACTYPPTAPPGVVGEEAAIARARAAVSDGDATTTVVWAVVDRASSGVPPGHVWVVRLEGAGLDQSPCPSGYLDGPSDLAAPPCLDGEGGLDVVMDAFSTEVLGTRH
jgi:hypothetical protein